MDVRRFSLSVRSLDIIQSGTYRLWTYSIVCNKNDSCWSPLPSCLVSSVFSLFLSLSHSISLSLFVSLSLSLFPSLSLSLSFSLSIYLSLSLSLSLCLSLSLYLSIYLSLSLSLSPSFRVFSIPSTPSPLMTSSPSVTGSGSGKLIQLDRKSVV